MNVQKTVSKSVGLVMIAALIGLAMGTALVPVTSASASEVLLASVAITASPNTICIGQSAHLSWSSTDATSVSIDQGIGSVLPFGERNVSPTQTTTYTITGSNTTGGYAVASVTVYVSGSCASPTPTWTPYPTNLRCSPEYSSVNSGEYVTFNAYSDYTTDMWPQRELTWSALGGRPSSGTGWTFRTRFTTDSINETRVVTVTDGYRTASCTVFVSGPTWTPTPTPYTLRCSPESTTADSGDRVTFTARGGDGSYSWYAPEGSPTYGYDDSFRTRFTNDNWYAQYRYVTVTSGWQTATCTVLVDGTSYWTPTPTPYYDSLQCWSDVSVANSGQRVTFTARGGDGSYHWYAADGSPTNDSGRSFQTRFYNNAWYSQYRYATVTSGWQTATCGLNINAGNPTPYPTWTPYPTATIYPYIDTIAGIGLSQTGRNVSRGQTGEFSSIVARGGDTLDLIVRLRSANSAQLNNAFVTVLVPAGLTYISGSTTVNGYSSGDGVTSSGINVGTINAATHTTVKFSVRVEASAVPSWGTVTVNSNAQARADGVGAVSASLPITLGTSASITAVSSVKTGPVDSIWMAALMAFLVTGAYAAYTRTDMFGRRAAHAEASRLSRSSVGLNFVR